MKSNRGRPRKEYTFQELLDKLNQERERIRLFNKKKRQKRLEILNGTTSNTSSVDGLRPENGDTDLES